MRKSSLFLAFAALALCLSTAVAQDRLEVGTTFDLASKYVWRGINVVDDQVYQPGVSLTAFGLSLGYWGNIDATDINGEEHEFTEHDLTLSYGLNLGGAGSLEAGLIYYYFPSLEDGLGQDDRDTSELYLKYSAPISFLSLSVAGYYDVDEADSWYAMVSAGKDFEMEGGLTASLGLDVGYGGRNYNNFYHGVKHADWNDMTLSAGLSGKLTKSIDWSVSFKYTEFLDGAIADGIDAGDDGIKGTGDDGKADNFWMVIGISTSF